MCCHGKVKRVGNYVFEFDLEAAAPNVIGDEEWGDVDFLEEDETQIDFQ